MATVSISVDTNTRQSVLTIDGQIIPAIACHFSKGIDFDGKPFTRLRYVFEAKNEGGLTQLTEFFLPDDDDEAVIANNQGFVSKPIKDKGLTTFDVQQAKEDTIRFLSK